MSTSKFMYQPSRRLRIAAVALAATLGVGAASAAAPDHSRPGGPRGHHFFSGIQKLHDGLKLSPEQDAKWKQAQDQMRDTRKASRARHQETHSHVKAALERPDVDFRDLANEQDRAREQDAAARRQVRDQWLAFYDTLNPNQKEQVRLFMKERMERGEKFRAKMRERMESRSKQQAQ